MSEEGSYFGSEKVDIKEELNDLKEKKTSQLSLVWLRYKRNKLALFGGAIVLTLIIMAIFAPFIAPYSPTDTEAGEQHESPSSEHLLGTDYLSRDVFSRIVFGTRYALMLIFLIVGIAGGIGIPLGLVAGYFGGWVDELIMRVVDAFLAFPVIIFAVALSTSLGEGMTPVIVATGLILWTRFARVTRGEVLTVKQERYIEGAEAIGESRLSIIFRYLLPNVLPSIIVVATIMMPSALLYSAALSYLGTGAQPPTPEWGLIVKQGAEHMMWQPHVVTAAGIFIVLTVLGFNFMGDGLRDALDPMTQGES